MADYPILQELASEHPRIFVPPVRAEVRQVLAEVERLRAEVERLRAEVERPMLRRLR